MTLPTPRYVVRSVTGREIRADKDGTGGNKPLPTSYYVLDSWYLHRDVAWFDSGNPRWQNKTDAQRRAAALARAAELNVETT